jgi:hypothetical protein
MADENEKPEVYFCTECGVAVNMEDTTCPKCGADLTEIVDLTGNEDETEKIDEVILKVFMNEIDAQLAKEQLQSEGIKCFIMSDNYGGMMPSLNLTGGVKLIVNEYNLERATEILKAMDMY